MKLTASNLSPAPRGNVLIMTLVFSGIVALTTAGYLSLAKSRALIRARSTAWNAALPVAEAGVEEGFTHLQKDAKDLKANGWKGRAIGSQPVYTKSRTFPDGSYFSVTLYTLLPNRPLIYSSGFVPAPLSAGYLSRTVRVEAMQRPTFTSAIAATDTIRFTGGSSTDSFNSSNTNGSTGGKYDPAKRGANGRVVTNSGAQPAIDVGTGHVYGQLATGPGGTVSVNGSGAVGDLAWQASHTGIQPGYVANDMNVAYPDAALPSAFVGLPPVGGTVKGTNYSYVLSSGNYQLTTLTLTSGQAILVNGNAVLYVSGNISVSGDNACIYLAPGATLDLYAGGALTDISGGGVVNGAGNAANFSYYGLTNNTSLKYTGGAAFVGTVYAPRAVLAMGGSADLYGACIVKSVAATGGAAFHYDEVLAGPRYLALVSYTEL
jgi:hypothetical protein